MERGVVKEAVIAVLTEIQSSSGLDCPGLLDDIIPGEEVPGFDSEIGLVATGLLALKLGVEIPNDVNLFFERKTKRPRSIDEVITLVCDLAAKQPKKKEGAL